MSAVVERWYAAAVADDSQSEIAQCYLPRDPVEMVLQKLAGPDSENATETAEGKTNVYQRITVEGLNATWQATVDELAKGGIAVTNAQSALEGALSIR